MQNVMPLTRIGFSQTVAERLNAKLVSAPDGCIVWTGARRGYGYGHMGRGASGAGFEATHRVAWMLVNGPIPDGICVCHKCDNPPCCNVDHLFLGTPADNARDMWEKGRGPSATLIRGGQEHPDAKLDDAEVSQMRAIYPSIRNYAELGRMFGVSKQHARSIVLRTKRAA